MIIKEIIFLNGACSQKGNGLFCFSHLMPCASRFTIEGLRYVYPPKPWRRQALCFFADTQHGHVTRF